MSKRPNNLRSTCTIENIGKKNKFSYKYIFVSPVARWAELASYIVLSKYKIKYLTLHLCSEGEIYALLSEPSTAVLTNKNGVGKKGSERKEKEE